jgi:secreted trypsin-like serine protease
MLNFVLILGLIAVAAADDDCGVPAIAPTNVGGATGKNSIEGKIVGGVEANPHSWPWMVALLESGNFQFCGGSLIAPQWIMTAGHCFYGHSNTPNKYTVRLGAHDDMNSESTQMDAKVEAIFVHPQFNPRAISHDITLLKLKNPVTYTDAISPVCLPAASDPDDPAGTNGVVTGWGSTQEGGNTVQRLRQVVVPIVDHQVCKREYALIGKLDDTMICAGLTNGGKDSCQGDSGGPFVFYKNNKWVQTGIVSWGKGCAEAGYAGVYGRVASFLDFIQQTMDNN